MSPPPPPVDIELLEEERRKTRESWLHAWDQQLRSWVGQVASISRKDTGHANRARKDLLQMLRKEAQQPQKGEPTDLPAAAQIAGWFMESMGVCNTWSEEQKAGFRSAILEDCS